MKIYSNSDIRAIEDQALHQRGMTRSEMCRELARPLADAIEGICPIGTPVVVFAGPELCGAYSLEAARCMVDDGRDVQVYLFNVGGNRLSAECRDARDHMVADCGTDHLCEVTGMQFTLPELSPAKLIVDGLFGLERSEPLTGGYQHLVRIINDSGAQIVAIDVPSGLSTDSRTGLIDRNIIHANHTLAIALPRRAFFMKENAELVGHWRVVPFELGAKALSSRKSDYYIVDKSDVKQIIGPRRAFSSKVDFGHAIIFAGSYGMMGAAVLAARAALRAGCGRLTVHGPRCGYFVLQTAVPSAMYDTDPGDVMITGIGIDKKFDAVAIGPGIGRADATLQALDDFLKLADANGRPVVLDADALNCMALRPSMLTHIPPQSIITPHEGEFDRLFGPHPTSEARLEKAIEKAAFHQIFIVLKGHYTTIVWPDGKVYFNPTGTPALATAGSGDVLTGIIVALMAQGIPPELASIAGVYIHGVSGRLAARRHSDYGVTAEDIAEYTGRAIRHILM